jgi:hypothetical protein
LPLPTGLLLPHPTKNAASINEDETTAKRAIVRVMKQPPG